MPHDNNMSYRKNLDQKDINKIFELKHKHNISQVNIAKRFQVSQNLISRILNNKYKKKGG